jgi:hypothetical protein
MSDTIRIGDREYVRLRYGPLDLVSLEDITASEIEQLLPRDQRWERLGLLLDPHGACGNDHRQVWRYLRVFWGFIISRAGFAWTFDLDAIAARIHLHEEPIIIGLWDPQFRLPLIERARTQGAEDEQDPDGAAPDDPHGPHAD